MIIKSLQEKYIADGIQLYFKNGMQAFENENYMTVAMFLLAVLDNRVNKLVDFPNQRMRYKVKGVMGCSNRHVEEETLIKAYLMAWNALVENREAFMERWKEQMQSENLLEGYRAEKFIEYTDGAQLLTEMDTDFMLKILDHIKVFEDGTLMVVFLEGAEIECKNEEE